MSEQSIRAQISEQEQIEYREVPGYPNYRVGSDGTVWSRCRPGVRAVASGWLLKRARKVVGGYLQVELKNEHGPKGLKVHRLVLLAFIGPPPQGCESCHANGVRDDNRLCNLRWDTRKANLEDKIRHGTWPSGSKNARAKLDELKVAEIRKRLSQGERGIDLAEIYGVSDSAIDFVRKGTTWKHVIAESD